MSKKIEGFSKFTKSEKIDWITKTHFKNAKQAKKQLESYWSLDSKLQARHEEFIENTLSNFYLPLGVAPNFLINGDIYTLPMVIEESSVVAAAANAAKFWSKRGGFKTKVINSLKVGQIHFFYEGNQEELLAFFKNRKSDLLKTLVPLTKNMEARGGGVMSLDLIDKCDILENYYQLHLRFKTGDAMGANVTNTMCEIVAPLIEKITGGKTLLRILSNYSTKRMVTVSAIFDKDAVGGEQVVNDMISAFEFADNDVYRAVTHNKGVMNGTISVANATGQDSRAIEAAAHAYAAKSGSYRSLTKWAKDANGNLVGDFELPLSVGIVGGVIQHHPIAKICTKILGVSTANELSCIMATAGLAQNFAAMRALVTEGIQKGHMKLHARKESKN